MLESFKIGNYTDEKNGTGCTVILCEKGAVGGVSVRGSAPGTRETDLFKPSSLVEKINAVVLAGGSAFGLNASSGVMKYLHEKDIGFKSGDFYIPIVASAVLFDLEYKNFAFPTEENGYEACLNAKIGNFMSGSVGAGCGATVGKILGAEGASKGGLGCSVYKDGDLEFAVIVAVNALGDVVDEKGRIIAGAKSFDEFVNTFDALTSGGDYVIEPQNTTIACAITNAKISREQANKLADIMHDGYARAISPVHTLYDGDTAFLLSSGETQYDMVNLCAIAVLTTEKAIRAAVSSNS